MNQYPIAVPARPARSPGVRWAHAVAATAFCLICAEAFAQSGESFLQGAGKALSDKFNAAKNDLLVTNKLENAAIAKAKEELKGQFEEILTQKAEAMMRRYATLTILDNDIFLSPEAYATRGLGDKILKEKVEDVMKRYQLGATIGKKGLEYFDEFLENGLDGLTSKLAGDVSRELASALFGATLVQGVELGAEIVRAIGDQIMKYALETKLEATIQKMFGGQDGAVRYLMDENMRPAKLKGDLRKLWDGEDGEGIYALTGVYPGKGTDKGEDALFEALYDRLWELYNKVAAQTAEVRRLKRERARIAAELDKERYDMKGRMWALKQDYERRVNASRGEQKGLTSKAAAQVQQSADQIAQAYATEVMSKYPSGQFQMREPKLALPSAADIARELGAAANSSEVPRRSESLRKQAEENWKSFAEEFDKSNRSIYTPGSVQDQLYSALKTLDTASSACYASVEGLRAQEGQVRAQCVTPPDRCKALADFNAALNSAGESASQCANPLQERRGQIITNANNYEKQRAGYLDAMNPKLEAVRVQIETAAAARTRELAPTEAALNRLRGFGNQFRDASGSSSQVAVWEDEMKKLSFAAVDGYPGMGRLAYPKWSSGELFSFIAGWKSRLESQLQALQRQMSMLEGAEQRTIPEVVRRKANLEAMASRVQELENEVAALGLSGDPLTRPLADFRSLKASLDKAGAHALEVGARLEKLRAGYNESVSNLRSDIVYLDGLIKKLDAVRKLLLADSIEGVRPVQLGWVGENSTTMRNFLTTSPAGTPAANLSLVTNTQMSGIASRMFSAFEQTGMLRFDEQNNIGIKAAIEARIAELGKLAIATTDFAIVEGYVLTDVSRVGKLAVALRDIPASSYGSYTYKEGIRNRTFAEQLRKALGVGVAFALGVEATADQQQRISAKLETVQKVASNHANPAVRTGADGIAKALAEHLGRYNAQVDQENKKFAEDAKKADEDQQKWTKCIGTTSPQLIASVCGATPGATPTTTATSAPAPSLPPGGGAGQPQRPAAPGQAGTPAPPAGALPGIAAGAAPGATSPAGAPQRPAAPSVPSPAIAAAPAGGISLQAGAAATAAGPAPSSAATAPALASPARPSPTLPSPASSSPFGSPPGAPSQASQLSGSPAPQSPSRPPAATAASPSPIGAVGAAPTAPALMAAAPAQARAATSQPASPFGSPTAAGATSTLPAASVQSPFGGPATSTSAQGASRAAPAAVQSPFGGPSAAPPAQATSPFGAPAAQASARPAQGGAQAPSPGATPVSPAVPVPGAAMPATGPDPVQQIREMYQRFAEAYQRKDARGVMKYISNDWKSADGASAPELEDRLSNSFRVFDTIQFQIQGLQIQKSGANDYRISYQTSLTGKNLKSNLQRQDKANITDTVVIGTDGPRITKTAGGSLAAK